MLNELKSKDNAYLACSIILFVLVILPYLIVATYASPSADDFSNLLVTFRSTGATFWEKAVDASIECYKTWQGTYTGSFICFTAGYIFYKFGLFGLHLEYICNICLFFLAIWCVMFSVFNRFNIECKKIFSWTFITTSVIVFAILYDFDVSEVFYWHTGLSVYTVPLSVSLFVIAILLKERIKNWEIIVASLLGIIAAGGALDISAFVCGTSLLISFFKCIKNKQIDKSSMVFLATFLGAVINAAAPGNYVRHKVISDQFPIWNSIKYSCSGIVKALWDYSGNGTIILLIILGLFLFNKLKKANFTYVNPILLAVLLFIGLVIIDFPIYLGYASGNDFPLRVEFVRRVSMSIFLFALILNTMGWFAKKSEKELQCSIENYIAVVVMTVIALSTCAPSGCWDGIKPFKIYSDIYFNSTKQRLTQFEEATRTVLTTLENSVGQDVIVRVPDYNSLGYLKSIGLTVDPGYWVNVGLAEYYGSNSVILIIGE